jgi:DNA polymerase elongation subunit (family B)
MVDNTRNEPLLYLFCRDENKQRQVLTVYGFEPYFYAEPFAIFETQKGVKRIEKGERWDFRELDKIIVNVPKDVKELSEELPSNLTYENTIPFTNRFMIDKGIYKGIEIDDSIDISKPIHHDVLKPIDFTTDLRIGYFDIEIVCVKGNLDVNQELKDVIRNASNIISHISLVDSYTDIRYSFELDPYNKFFKENKNIKRITKQTSESKFYKKEWVNFDLSRNRNIYHTRYANERTLITDFLMLVKRLDFDVIEAYNLDGFDYPYTFKRSKKLGINFNKVSPMGIASFNKINGLELIDTYRMIKDKKSKELLELNLDYVSKEFVPERTKVDLESKISKTLIDIIYKKTGSKSIPSNLISWIFYYGTKSDRRLLTCYNLEDSVVMSKIDEKERLTKSRQSRAKVYGCHMSQTFSTTVFAYQLLLRHASFVLPKIDYEERLKRKENKKSDLKGAIVLDPYYGVLNNVIVPDYSKLYPRIIIDYNIGFRTIDNKNGDIILNDDYKFTSEYESIFVKVFKSLFNYRGSLQKRMKQLEPNSTDYKMLDDEQFSVKQGINSFYGLLDYFIDMFEHLASCVTYAGRELITITENQINTKTPFKCVYGDTDSVFIYLGKNLSEDKVLEYGFKIEKSLNKYYQIYLKKKGIKSPTIKIEFEKYGVFAQAGVKKRYAMKILWNKDWKHKSVEYMFKGLETKRSDKSKATRELQKKAWSMMLDFKEEEEIEEMVRNEIIKLKEKKADLMRYTKPVKISKELGEYKGSYANHSNIRAARYSRQIGINIGTGKYKVLPFKNLKTNPWKLQVSRKKDNYIMFSRLSEITEFLKYCEIDIDTIIKKDIFTPLEDVFNLKSIYINDLLSEGTQFDLRSIRK